MSPILTGMTAARLGVIRIQTRDMIRDPNQPRQQAIPLPSNANRKNAPIMMLAPVLTPRGLLILRETEDALGLESVEHPRLAEAFLRGPGHGLLRLGADEVETTLPPVLSYWREFGSRYVTALCAVSDIGDRFAKPLVAVPADGELDHMAAAVPPMTGGEYLTADVLADLWRDMDAAFDAELADAGLSVQEFLKGRHPAWNLIGRVHFNLAENRNVIADLPDKTEVNAFCSLSRKQAALYQQAVEELARRLEDVDGMQRKGLVLAFLMRLKQVCNHPSQWLGDGAWTEQDSGKFERLRDIAEVVAARQEKALIFTQFKETTAPLAAFLGSVFGRAGLVLHGETEVKKRKELVRQFQDDENVSFFVLSLKAGGTGLNLTAASHVVHFDRWWNPAVENQATDRAFRIGQTKNVLVHKFVCRGTVEDKIDKLIESKKQLAGDLLGPVSDLVLTEMKDEELLKLVALDLNAATKEARG